ncbi:MAG: methyl-accepting chemotaxis protein, partial [Phenylobacterium sp.]|nr:methyl-accepting chemotaxis protein [Phenylobacterium sp.]
MTNSRALTLEDQRAFGLKVLNALICLFIPLVGLAAFLNGGPWIGLSLAVAALAGASLLMTRVGGAAARLTLGVALMGAVSLLVAAFAGAPWQVDMHMAYFAALATLIVFCDWRAIVAGAGTVAVHHLVLSFVLPAAVFPGGGDIGRVLVHAVILVIEAAVLVWAALRILQMFATSTTAVAEAQAARQTAEGATLAVEESRAAEAIAAQERLDLQQAVDEERKAVVEGLAAGLDKLAQGVLTYRIGKAFTPQYEALRRDFNSAAERLQDALGVISQAATNMSGGAGEISQ